MFLLKDTSTVLVCSTFYFEREFLHNFRWVLSSVKIDFILKQTGTYYLGIRLRRFVQFFQYWD